MKDPLKRSVLVLNQGYEPINVCPMRRAVLLVWKGTATVLVNADGTLDGAGKLPAVIYLGHSPSRRYRTATRLTRRDVFRRDSYSCQYCGVLGTGQSLTLDHVIPRSRGGSHHWENVVTACSQCNRRKADHLPSEIRMHPKRPPSAPRWSPATFLLGYGTATLHKLWSPYVGKTAE